MCPAWLLSALLSVPEMHTYLDNTSATLTVMLEPEVDVKSSTCVVNMQHILSMQSQSSISALTGEMLGLFTCLFQETEQGE